MGRIHLCLFITEVTEINCTDKCHSHCVEWLYCPMKYFNNSLYASKTLAELNTVSFEQLALLKIKQPAIVASCGCVQDERKPCLCLHKPQRVLQWTKERMIP